MTSFEQFPTSGYRGRINYNGLEFSVNAEIAEDLMEVLYSLDALGGGHLFLIPATTGEMVRLWITRGVPIVVTLPPEYEIGRLPRSYVEMMVRASQLP